MKQERFDICWDDDCSDILDWINSHFRDGNHHKDFEIKIIAREIDYDEDGNKHYVFK